MKNHRPYPAYKPTGLAWLPEVPREWEMLRGKFLFTKMERPVRPQDEVVTCFRDGEVTLRKNRRLEGFTESLKEIGYQGVRKGDLVIHVMDAFAGSVGVSDSDGKSTPVYSVCVPKKSGINNYYYAHIVRVMAKTGYIQSLYRGIRERSSDFRFEVFGNQFLPIPPPAEQEAIVAYLDEKTAKIDRLIELKEREIKLLNEKKQAVISKVVTRGLDPNAELVDSGVDWIGKVPRGWRMSKLSYRYSVQLGKMLNASRFKGDYAVPYLRNQDVQWDSVNTVDLPLMDIKPEERERFSAKEGDLLLCEGGEIGRCCVWEKKEIVYFQKAIMRLRPHERTMDCVRYLWHLLRAASAHSAFVNATGKATIAHLPAEKLSAARLPFPPLSEQREIVAYLDAEGAKTDKAIAAVARQIGLLKEYRTRLISDAVTGRIDLRG